VSFVDSDDDDDTSPGKEIPEELPERMESHRLEEQEPMGEPEPSPDGDPSGPDETDVMVAASPPHVGDPSGADETDAMVAASPTHAGNSNPLHNNQEEVGVCCLPEDCGDKMLDACDASNGRSYTPRRELRLSMDVSGLGAQSSSAATVAMDDSQIQVTSSAEQIAPPSFGRDESSEGVGKQPGPTSRRAKLRGRMHGYSICEAEE
jgi:hypothetical protein